MREGPEGREKVWFLLYVGTDFLSYGHVQHNAKPAVDPSVY